MSDERVGPVRVVLADDEAMIRAGVRAILATDPGIEVVAEAGDADGGGVVRAHRPRCAAGQSDADVGRTVPAAEIRRLVPQTAPCHVTTFGEDDTSTRGARAGASGSC